MIAGNWKMNLNHVEAVALVQKLAWNLADHDWDPEKSECVVFPPFTDLRTVQTLVEGDELGISYGAQDLSQHDNGAFTGDVSGDMLVKLGCKYVIIGHSERRQYHLESDYVVHSKVRKALAKGLRPVLCVGEGLEVREQGGAVSYCLDQVRAALLDISVEDARNVVVAYEPIWAIGTGQVATPEDAQEVCGAIREQLRRSYGDVADNEIRVLYGGSVKSTTIAELMSKPDVDGALVGGASLDANEFAAITRFYALPQIRQ